METNDKNANPFLETGDYVYVAKFQKIDTSLNKLIDEVIAFQTIWGATTLQGAIELMMVDFLQNKIVQGPGITCVYNAETGILTISAVEI